MDHELPDEENILKFYIYTFAGLDQKVTIEAYNRIEARIALQKYLTQMPIEYGYSKVIDETIETPIQGVSRRTIDGVQHIWAGRKYTQSGWIEQNEYIEKFKPTTI